MSEVEADSRGSTGRAARGNQRTYEKLLLAGRKVFAERGWHDTTIDDVITAAGVSHGSFYVYFENKQDLFQKLIDPVMDDLFQRAAARRRGDSIFSRLEAGNRALLELWELAPDLMYNLVEAAQGDPVIHRRNRAMQDRFITRTTAALQRHKAEGITHDIDPVFAAAALAGMVTAFATRHLRPGETRPAGYNDVLSMSYALTALWYRAVYSAAAPPIPAEEEYRQQVAALEETNEIVGRR